MISHGTFGEGKNKIQFYWRESNLEYHTVAFKTHKRTGIACILIDFRREQRDLRNNRSRDFGEANIMKLLARNNPRCKIKTKDKNGKPIEKEYLFNWRINGHVTIQQMQRIMKRKDR